MGTDIYLEWKSKTKKDKQMQYTGFSIDSGDVGYLRASIGMVRENTLLREIFPEQYWNEHSKTEYDFRGNFERVIKLGFLFLVNCLTGKEDFEISKEQTSQIKTGSLILKQLKNLGFSNGQILISGNNQDDAYTEFRYGVMWLNSLFDFFNLGIAKQEEGLNPYPYISW